MSVIYKRFTGSVLSDILVAANVILDWSVEQAFNGILYKSGMRCPKLMYKILLRRLIRHGQNEGLGLPDYLKVKLYKLRNISDISEEEIINAPTPRSKNSKFQIVYLLWNI